MGREVAVANGRGTSVATVSANPFLDAARSVESGAYLKFNGNDGRWSFGKDDEELPEGSRAVGSMSTLAFGWMCWVDSSVEEEVLVAVLDGSPPLEHQLTDHGPYNDDDGWREAASLSLVLESFGNDDQHEFVGEPLLWKSSTGGQVRQIRKLSGAYGRVMAQHPGEHPIIELGAESYVPKNKKFGKLKWSPTLKIVGWLTDAELAGFAKDAGDDDDGYDDDQGEPAPQTRGRAAPEPEPEPAPRRGRGAPAEDAAPAPRRGRGAPVEPQDDAGEDEGEPAAPAPRRGRGAPAEDAAPAPRRGRGAPAETDEGDEGDAAEAPTPRGRSPGRGAAPAGARVRTFR